MDDLFTIAYKGLCSEFYRPLYGISFKSIDSALTFLDVIKKASSSDVNYIIISF